MELIKVLDHPEARAIYESIEGMRLAYGGSVRYAAEIEHALREIEKLTGVYLG